jgi:hypothetical protein
MKTVLSIVLFGLFAQAHAETQLVMGKEQGVRAAFCESQADAEAVARADSEEGIPKAREILAERACGLGTAYVQPRRVTFSGKTERGATVRVFEVVVELGDTKHTVYMIADTEVVGLVET